MTAEKIKLSAAVVVAVLTGILLGDFAGVIRMSTAYMERGSCVAEVKDDAGHVHIIPGKPTLVSVD